MLTPSRFQVDEAWIAFRLNDAPVRTEQDGSFNVIALMDAASCFILGAEFVAAGKAEPSAAEVKRLLKGGQKQSKKLPMTLFLPQDQFPTSFVVEAERCGISLVRVHESQLLIFIGEARRGFNERFSEGNVREA